MVTDSPRIVHVIPSMASRTGGPAFSTAGTALSCQQFGAVVTTLTTDLISPAQTRPVAKGATVSDMPSECEELDVRVFPVQQPYRWAYSPELSTAANQESIHADILHIHSLNLHPQFAAWRAALRSDKPYIVSPRGAMDPYLRAFGRLRKTVNNRLWQNRMLADASLIHFTTEDEERLAGCSDTVVGSRVVPNGIDSSQFAAPANGRHFRDRWLGGFDGQIVMNHGRLSRKKNLELLLTALHLASNCRPLALVLLGPDDEGLSTRLTAQARTLGIERSLFIIEALDGVDLLDALASADVWALPSSTENFGRAVAEAMAAAKPVVTSPHVNIAPEAAAAGAMVMVDNEPDLIAAEIVKLLNDPARRQQLGQRAHEYVKRFDWKELGPQYIDMYNDAIEYHQHRGPYKRRFWEGFR